MARQNTIDMLVIQIRRLRRFSPQMQTVPVCRRLEITESRWNRWGNQYGGMKADEAKR